MGMGVDGRGRGRGRPMSGSHTHTHMEGLADSMKLILVALNIARVENTRTIKQNIGTRVASNST